MPRPIPGHGTYARARGTSTRPSCPCDCCRLAERRYDKQLRLIYARGQRNRVPAPPVRTRLRQLRAGGASWQQIADASGIGCSRLTQLIREDRPTVRSSTAARVMAIGSADELTGGPRHVPVLGGTRRVQALMAIGHTHRSIAAEAGLNTQTVSEVLNQHSLQIPRFWHEALAGAYDRLWRSTGTSVRNRTRAAREGWAGPLHWDETTIDDPAGFPDWTGHCGSGDGWLLHLFEGQKPCAACTPHAVNAQGRSISRALADECGQGLLVIADSGRGWFAAAQSIGILARQLEYARQLVKSKNLERAA